MASLDIALLSVSMNVYSTSRIAEEARMRGHYIEQIDHTRCTVHLGGEKPRIYFEGDDITEAFDAVIPRIGTRVTRHGSAIVKQFEDAGVFSTARSVGISRARNKARTLQIMARRGIPIPRTLFSIDPETVETQIELLGGPPVIIKLQEGTQGLGVILAESDKSARSIIDTFYKMDTSILLQQFIPEAGAEDIRVIVVGNRVVAAMKRIGAGGDFRANVHRGGQTEKVKLTKTEQRIAAEAVRHLRLGVAGVDLIRSANGPMLLEVNASPGLHGIETTTGINVAMAIVEFVEENYRRLRR